MRAGSAAPRAIAADIEQSKSHEHICMPHRTCHESAAAAVAFIRGGLRRREQCAYIAEHPASSTILDDLQSGGVAVGDATRAGALSLLGGENTYLADGYFDPDRMLAWIRRRALAAGRTGFSGFRLVGEMIIVSGRHPGVDRLHEYESKLNYLIADQRVAAFCHYNRARFGARDIREAITTHPCVVVERTVCRSNPVFVPPDEYLAFDRPVGEVDRLLHMLRRDELAHATLGESLEHYRGLSRRLLEAQEAERRAIARDLHDDLAQILTTIHLGLQAAGAASTGRRARDLAETDALVVEAMTYVGRVAIDVRPALLDDLGLAAALRAHVRTQARRAGFEVTLDLEALEEPLPSFAATTGFRIVQEALANIARHAAAAHVGVKVGSTGGALEVVVEDDGKGFDVRAAHQRGARGSIGLLSMEERTSLVGGTFTVESTPGHGATIRARIPLTPGKPS